MFLTNCWALAQGVADLELLNMKADYAQTSLRGTKADWRKTAPNQKQGTRLNVYVMLRLTKAFRS